MPNTRRKTLNANTKLPSGGPTAVAIVRLLVDRSLSYAEVARRVRKGMPGTQASVTIRLRREGYRVPDRRFAQPLTN